MHASGIAAHDALANVGGMMSEQLARLEGMSGELEGLGATSRGVAATLEAGLVEVRALGAAAGVLDAKLDASLATEARRAATPLPRRLPPSGRCPLQPAARRRL